MWKLEGNAPYGTLITNKEKHHDIIYVDVSEISRQIISPHFYDMTKLPDGYYEVERTKPSINLNIPTNMPNTQPKICQVWRIWGKGF